MTRREHYNDYVSAMFAHLPSPNRCDIADLSKVAASLHHLDEVACNAELTKRQETRVANLEKKAKTLAVGMGAVDVVINGDPRGGSVYVVCPDGYTNDWGHQGICVEW